MKINVAYLFLLHTFFCLLISCSTRKLKDENISIIIKVGDNYEYNLNDDTFKAFGINDSLVTKFVLTKRTKQNIIKEYYLFRLNEIPVKTKYVDGCAIMPKFYNTLITKSKDRIQEIIVDESCDIFFPADTLLAKHVQFFINHTTNIIDSIPAIKEIKKHSLGKIYM